jgi:hypothetical protein
MADSAKANASIDRQALTPPQYGNARGGLRGGAVRPRPGSLS